MTDQSHIRNFCIIAHIDHGKSTLADRLLEITGAVEKRKMKEQMLDSMDLERERGITIKLAPARMNYKDYTLNLIDTPGHVDFNYEVSRSLAAVEGAILLVDATQGVQAQTVGNLFLAVAEDLAIIPVLNKIDLPAADIPRRTEEIVRLLGCDPSEILSVSGKTGQGVPELLDAVLKHIPPPSGHPVDSSRALVFDSKYDDYKGVVAYVRVTDGGLKTGDRIHMIATGSEGEILELGALGPGGYMPLSQLETGQIGYVVTGLKDLLSCRVGDTLTSAEHAATEPLSGYREVRPMVFAGIFPKEGNDYQRLREGMEKLKLNDAALSYEPEHSPAMGYGFRCGLLGMLHLEIVKERLQREYGMEVLVTTPSVAYRLITNSGEETVIKSPLQLPDPTHIQSIKEPWVKADIVTPKESIGAIMTLAQERRGMYLNTEYLSDSRAILHYEIPLATVIVDFYDKLKSISSGYASFNYEFFAEREADVVRLDILVAEDMVDAFATLVYRDEAERVGRQMVETLKESIPKHWFVVKIQAAVGGKIVAADRISALRKDVTAKLYGGDVTRKRKLLEKQKKGKAKMAEYGKGSVDIPSDAYLNLLKRG
ncbi:MAG: Elongation factor 4 [Candidatus Uhrbacteria bacterium GW2011_GWF2_41_16]|uniref:Elongation factor 4 n=2 Tax=Candidatus Uhriibacteriota TaxID=1752732 RepID=A0A0G0XL12_9BACT|nr:MAG: Elongation factor 4 [Candidatus Uhrbacteria bacterium GW2011_GWA2_41_10]KKR86657.1 MAG: Elongation factor 4 [Candidatus Uhrbacteria bacterium GW2011_GWC2_41_11]KKR97475.1 MAG: Elongation factor 4 [Candidatus Uhrbacteria bacterium GW2011_GWF2_41_16]HBP00153.1 elongation factor 4 [Candidatus Uhrbacteria bacterium]